MDLLLEVYPESYGPFVTTDNKCERVMILQCINFIYVTMVARLLYHKKLFKTLKMNGLKINSYYTCVADHLVSNNQQTIFFHVDDCKLRHQDSKVNDKYVNTLCYEYDTVLEDVSGKMKAILGKLYDYLGINLDYSVKGQVIITMMDYIKEILKLKHSTRSQQLCYLLKK